MPHCSWTPRDTEAIADGLSRLLADDGERERLVPLGRARAGSHTWERCARETLDFLASRLVD